MPASDINLKKASILIVDDNRVNLDVIAESLQSADLVNITKVSQPLELSTLLKEQRFDLILLDVNMPFIDGFAALSMIRHNNSEQRQTPVIMITAQADEQCRIKALQSGADDFICKPFNRIELIKRAEIHLKNHLSKKRLIADNKAQALRDKAYLQKIETEQLELIQYLSRSLEYQENRNGNHIKRISHFAKLIAEKHEQDADYCQLIFAAAALHDIGKTGVSDAIWLKPDPLTEDEHLSMQSHVRIGAEIVKNAESELLQMAHEIILGHHEKYDGSGYPQGIAATEIPLSARITAIADVFDALISHRPYREAWDFEQAVAHISAEKGKHFDPDLVDAFLQVLPNIQTIAHRYRD